MPFLNMIFPHNAHTHTHTHSGGGRDALAVHSLDVLLREVAKEGVCEHSHTQPQNFATGRTSKTENLPKNFNPRQGAWCGGAKKTSTPY